MDSVGFLLCCYCVGKSHEDAMYSDGPASYIYYYKGQIVKYNSKGDESVKNHLIEFPILGEVVNDYVRLIKLKMFIDSMVIKHIMRHNQGDMSIPDDSGIASYHPRYNELFDKALIVAERDYKITKILE